jgi:hypothetical protein
VGTDQGFLGHLIIHTLKRDIPGIALILTALEEKLCDLTPKGGTAHPGEKDARDHQDRVFKSIKGCDIQVIK